MNTIQMNTVQMGAGPIGTGPMNTACSTTTACEARDDIAWVMDGLCRGDAEAHLRFWELAQPRVRSIMRVALGDMASWLGAGQLDDMVRNGVVTLIELAPSWRSDGGALPWNWASARLRQIAWESFGVIADDIETLMATSDRARPKAEGKELSARLLQRRSSDTIIELATAEDPGERVTASGCAVPHPDQRSGLEVLEQVASSSSGARAFERALRQVASEEHATVFVEVLMEEAGGNSSAAVTVAEAHGLRSDNVRKIRSRVAKRLAGLDECEWAR